MRKIALALLSATLLLVVTAAVAFADPAKSACNGLDVAQGQIYGNGAQEGTTLDDVRAAHHCGH